MLPENVISKLLLFSFIFMMLLPVFGKNEIRAMERAESEMEFNAATAYAAAQTSKLKIPALVSAKVTGTSKITVTWEKVKGATGYVLYRKKDDSKWKKVIKLTGINTVSYMDTALEPGTRYYYTVRAYNNTFVSAYVKNGICATTNLSVPKLKSAVHTSQTSVKITWNSVAGARGYRLYKKVNGKWVKQATGKKTYWIGRKALSGENIYTVRAYRLNGTSCKWSGYVKNGIKSDQYNAYSMESNASFSYNWKKRGLTDVTDAFLNKVVSICKELNVKPDDLMTVMAFESGLNHTAVNLVSGATGLIQFLPSTAIAIGTTTYALKNMSAVEQLDYVYKYLAEWKRYGLSNIGDLYMSVLWPVAIGKPDSHVLWSTSYYAIYYNQNKGLDVNGDGKITKAETYQKVLSNRIYYV